MLQLAILLTVSYIVASITARLIAGLVSPPPVSPRSIIALLDNTADRLLHPGFPKRESKRPANPVNPIYPVYQGQPAYTEYMNDDESDKDIGDGTTLDYNTHNTPGDRPGSENATFQHHNERHHIRIKSAMNSTDFTQFLTNETAVNATIAFMGMDSVCPKMWKHVRSFATTASSRWRTPVIPDVMLVIVVNYPDVLQVLPLLEFLHRPAFRHIVYCGPDLGAFLAVTSSLGMTYLSYIEALPNRRSETGQGQIHINPHHSFIYLSAISCSKSCCFKLQY